MKFSEFTFRALFVTAGGYALTGISAVVANHPFNNVKDSNINFIKLWLPSLSMYPMLWVLIRKSRSVLVLETGRENRIGMPLWFANVAHRPILYFYFSEYKI